MEKHIRKDLESYTENHIRKIIYGRGLSHIRKVIYDQTYTVGSWVIYGQIIIYGRVIYGIPVCNHDSRGQGIPLSRIWLLIYGCPYIVNHISTSRAYICCICWNAGLQAPVCNDQRSSIAAAWVWHPGVSILETCTLTIYGRPYMIHHIRAVIYDSHIRYCAKDNHRTHILKRGVASTGLQWSNE